MAPICNRLDWRRAACKWLGYCRWSRPAAFEPVLSSGEAQWLAGTPTPNIHGKGKLAVAQFGSNTGEDVVFGVPNPPDSKYRSLPEERLRTAGEEAALRSPSPTDHELTDA